MASTRLSRPETVDQPTVALLGPIAAGLVRMEVRLQHYVDHVSMSASDQEMVERAHQIIARTRDEILRLATDHP